MRLSRDLRERLLQHALQELPCEACGLLGGRGAEILSYVPCRNARRSPVRYAIAPEEILAALRGFAADGLDLVAVFHSHPQGEAALSATDIAEAAYPGLLQIVAAPGRRRLRAFFIEGGRPREEPLEE